MATAHAQNFDRTAPEIPGGLQSMHTVQNQIPFRHKLNKDSWRDATVRKFNWRKQRQSPVTHFENTVKSTLVATCTDHFNGGLKTFQWELYIV